MLFLLISFLAFGRSDEVGCEPRGEGWGGGTVQFGAPFAVGERGAGLGRKDR